MEEFKHKYYVADFHEQGLGRMFLFSRNIPVILAFPEYKELIEYVGEQEYEGIQTVREKYPDLIPNTLYPPATIEIVWR